jgi:DNA polymerase III subunit epsilon
MIENVLVIDTETTGLSADKHKIIEIAGVLYNVQHKTILQQFSTLFPCDENPVEDINGINAEATRSSYDRMTIDILLRSFICYSQAIIAHNAQFDKGFFQQLILPEDNHWITIPWICTKQDFEWPVSLPRKRLQDVCEAMGVKYERAHRALSDCLFIVDCFSKMEDLESRLQKAYDKVIR